MGRSEDRTFLQCTDCGKIYDVYDDISIEALYVHSCCPRCGHIRALNIGNSEDEKYLYYDVSLDERYYKY